MTRTVVIFGGSGFIGRYIVRRLSKLGYRIIIPTSNYSKTLKLKLLGNLGQILPVYFNSLQYQNINKIIKDSDYVINLRTIWNEKKNKTYENIIYNLNKYIVDNIHNTKIKRYIFFSGIGTNINSKSKRTRAIANSENYIRKNLIDYSIIRPSIVIGNDDKFLNKLLPIFKFSLFIPLFGKGDKKIQPVFVDDIANAVEKLILKEEIDCNIYELGGSKIFSYKELYNFVINIMGKKRIFLKFPFSMIRFCIFFLEKLSIELLNFEQLELFKENNLVNIKSFKFENLNISPSDIKQIIKKIVENS